MPMPKKKNKATVLVKLEPLLKKELELIKKEIGASSISEVVESIVKAWRSKVA